LVIAHEKDSDGYDSRRRNSSQKFEKRPEGAAGPWKYTNEQTYSGSYRDRHRQSEQQGYRRGGQRRIQPPAFRERHQAIPPVRGGRKIGSRAGLQELPDAEKSNEREQSSGRWKRLHDEHEILSPRRGAHHCPPRN